MSADVSMNDVVPQAEDEAFIDDDKITVLPGMTSDGSAASFKIKDEDHTLGNTLKYMIMKNPEVEFCGYSIPHPNDNFMNLRIQTYGDITAIQALQKGLSDLVDVCDHVEETFREEYNQYTQKVIS